ncbi:hypothetical protein DUI87_06677 [Hirundo rustica rustica]|uniref:Uncharacterized protein n=1 Tax=Hirundo rustica rustica TaxID=333673 RepID=A0A3M0L037_HIRRU|nr:hypothetical protein DUI87_06677 [Hirundo rustica rustica]
MDPAVENPEWCRKWEIMNRTLTQFSDPIAWKFPRERIQDPDEVEKYLEEKSHGDSNDKKLIAICWAPACAYCTLLDTAGQQIEAGEQGDKSAATPVTQAAAKPDSEPKPMVVAPTTTGTKHKTKTDRPVDDDDDAGEEPSRSATGTISEATIESFPCRTFVA